MVKGIHTVRRHDLGELGTFVVVVVVVGSSTYWSSINVGQVVE